jgi:hypothetical protein
MKFLLQKLIRLYQIILSPWVGNQCRFYPTCSCYAHQALEKHGFWKGSFLMVRRICRCHPLTKSGFTDPVPDRFDFPWTNLWKGFAEKRRIRYNKPTSSPSKTNSTKD